MARRARRAAFSGYSRLNIRRGWIYEAAGGGVADEIPDAFSFTDQTGAAASTVTTSAPITVAGLGAGDSSAITVVGGTYSINGGSYVSTAGTVQNGDLVRARVTSSASASTAVNVTVTIGGVADTFSVTTVVDGDALSYIAAMTSQPDEDRRAAIDSAFVRMKARSYWAKLDWLSFTASHHEQAGRINLKNPAQIATVVGAPTFVADQGYAGAVDGTTGLDTSRNPTTAGGNYTLNSAHMAVWNLSSARAGGAASYVEISAGNGAAAVWSNFSGTMYVFANSGNSATYAVPFGNSSPYTLGHRGWSRTGATALKVYRDGTLVTTSAAASSALPNTNIVAKSPRRNAAMHFGGGLTDAEMLQIRDDIGTYFNEANIIPAFDVFLIVGDSNNASGASYDAAIDVSDPKVWATEVFVSEEILPAVSPNYLDATRVGYSIAFFRDYYIPGGELAAGRKILIIHAGQGATGLFTGGQEWRNGDTAHTSAILHTNRIMQTMPNAVLKAILGCEGANDITASVSDGTIQGAVFETQYDGMLTGLRTGITGGAALPIVMAGAPPLYLGTGNGVSIQASIAATGSRITGFAYANPSSPTVINDNVGDPIHYTAQGHRGTLGNPGGLAGRFWTAWQSL